MSRAMAACCACQVSNVCALQVWLQLMLLLEGVFAFYAETASQ